MFGFGIEAKRSRHLYTMLLYTTIIFLLLPTVCLLILFSTRRKPINSPPSPPKNLFFGNLLQLGALPHRTLKTLADSYGPIMLIHLGSKPALVVSSSDVAREIFQANDIAFSNRGTTSIIAKLLYNGKGVVATPYSNYWRQMRAIIVTKLLSSNRVQKFGRVREEEISTMISKVAAASSNPVNLSEQFSILTNEILCRVAFGKQLEAERQKRIQVLEETSKLLSAFDVAEAVPWLAWINNFNGLKSRIEKVFNDLDVMMDGILDEHLITETKGDEKDLVDILLEERNGGSVDKESVKAIILDVLVAGTETIKTTMEWMMLELLRNPEAMKKVKEEIREIIPDERIAKEDDLRRLKYMKCVIRETMRMHPAIPIMPPRKTGERVKVWGYEIEENTMVLVNVWAIGMDPKVWKEPGKFRPERFMEEGAVDYIGNDYDFIPFGAGRRRCPGMAFAASVIELGIATLLKNLDLSLPEGKEVDASEAAGVTFHPKYPILVMAKSLSSSLIA